jgi:hypothetical protein
MHKRAQCFWFPWLRHIGRQNAQMRAVFLVPLVTSIGFPCAISVSYVGERTPSDLSLGLRCRRVGEGKAKAGVRRAQHTRRDGNEELEKRALWVSVADGGGNGWKPLVWVGVKLIRDDLVVVQRAAHNEGADKGSCGPLLVSWARAARATNAGIMTTREASCDRNSRRAGHQTGARDGGRYALTVCDGGMRPRNPSRIEGEQGPAGLVLVGGRHSSGAIQQQLRPR